MTPATPITDAGLAELIEKASLPWRPCADSVATADGRIAMWAVPEGQCGRADDDYYKCTPRFKAKLRLPEFAIDLIYKVLPELPFLVHRLRTSEAAKAHLSSALMSLQSNRDAIEESLRETITALRARAEKAEAEVARLGTEVAALRVSLGQQTAEPAEPVGCPAPGACSCPAARPDPAQPGQSSARPAAGRVDAETAFRMGFVYGQGTQPSFTADEAWNLSETKLRAEQEGFGDA